MASKMLDNFGLSEEEAKLIQWRFPELRLLSMPSVDDLVTQFLNEHDVERRPASSKRSLAGDAFRGAVTGSAGIAAGGILFVEKNQRAIAASQEWTSWKQWALSHPEWNDFKRNAIRQTEAHNSGIEKLLAAPEKQKEIELYILRRRADTKRNKKYNIIAACGAGLGFVAVISFLHISGAFNIDNKPAGVVGDPSGERLNK